MTDPFGSLIARGGMTDPFGSLIARGGMTDPFGSLIARGGMTDPFGSLIARGGMTDPFGSLIARGGMNLLEVDELRSQFALVANDYYSFIYYFLNYAGCNRVEHCRLTICYTPTILELLEAWIDDIWDESMTFGNSLLDTMEMLECDVRFSLMINKLYSTSCLQDILVQANIIKFLKDITEKSIVLLDIQRRELLCTRKKVMDVCYRNRIARTAWIRKLAHFLIRDVTLYANDIVVDKHDADWFETYYQVSKTPGTKCGYRKMIGDVKELTTYDHCTKRSYTIVLPLIFNFNKYVANSLPLIASINMQYQIVVTLRKFDEVTYREPFSELTTIPKIRNAYCMCEYIYLSGEERMIFASRTIEYVIDEIQIGTPVNVTDNNVTCCNYHRTLAIPRIIYDQTGVAKLMMMPDIITSLKSTTITHYFHHPAKFMVTLIKPDLHTQPHLRHDDNYFYGEHQWDNYGLYSYYDLSRIHQVKACYYEDLQCQLNQVDHPVFGFNNIINLLLLEPLDQPVLEAAQCIKDYYLNYDRPFVDFTEFIASKFTGRFVKDIMFKNIIYQVTPLDCYDTLIRIEVINVIAAVMNRIFNKLFDEMCVEVADYQELLIRNPKVNPLIEGYLTMDSYNVMPENADDKFWSELQCWLYFNSTASVGVNLHSWALNPLDGSPSGTCNLSRIDDFESVLKLHPMIGNHYPVTVCNTVMNVNLLRCMSGLCGKGWSY